ncbi:hypothetical protein [Burkholderia pseudomultivorans]|uniref:Uncharacterized protein n=1 Tax=Burkholderia pseudomultivorans TaxID=1207504 RepID=A0A132EKI8_9BURK|nr:hypothetical protein [Burkholderia pseudomultivorans]KWF33815.1 hypothetical protein WT56_08555 [Burkholderia pseudomultivorans]MDR8729719.1 hypothetical protein [Burkholderia pseudomultivorans]MDR8737636.1 hypothetical protein [Burkholderia pseudomultivorans]MDR8743839.1 hypothetical protein [Burkholderia pseudomultivorans]MDR8755231.1 hypothetical protein [Burkholderia pseudomultivorans]
MKHQRYLSVLAAALLALGTVSAHAAAGGNGGGNGGGHGAGGSGGNAGGMSGGHMSGSALSNSNGFNAGDRDKGLSRAADRSDSIADRAGVQPGRGHSHGHTAHASTSTHHGRHHAFGRTL